MPNINRLNVGTGLTANRCTQVVQKLYIQTFKKTKQADRQKKKIFLRIQIRNTSILMTRMKLFRRINEQPSKIKKSSAGFLQKCEGQWKIIHRKSGTRLIPIRGVSFGFFRVLKFVPAPPAYNKR